MHQNIKQAAALYDEWQIQKTLERLSSRISQAVRAKTYNTLTAEHKKKILKTPDIFKHIRKTKDCSIYLHIPFCKARCSYCSYEKVIGLAPEERLRYLDLLVREIQMRKKIMGKNLNPVIYYLGGGTPFLLNLPELKILLQNLNRLFDLRRNLEFTIETDIRNLNQTDALEKLRFLKNQGVNRINIGVQSFSSAVTSRHGRLQTRRDIYSAFRKVQGLGFKKVNLDLIYGLLGQNFAVWQQDLENTCRIAPDSITTFELRIRKPTALYKTFKLHPEDFSSGRDRIIMRIMAQQYFKSHGFTEDNADYFIKSKDKKYLYHPAQPDNIGRNLIGFGPSAYSIAGDKIIFNIQDTFKYMNCVNNAKDPAQSVIELTRRELYKKRLADGLRTEFDDRRFFKEFSTSILNEYPEVLDFLFNLRLITINEDKIKLTAKGRIITDYISDYINYS